MRSCRRAARISTSSPGDVIKPAQARQKTQATRRSSPTVAAKACPEVRCRNHSSAPAARPVGKTNPPAEKRVRHRPPARREEGETSSPSEKRGGFTISSTPSMATMIPSAHFSVAPPRKQASTGQGRDRHILPGELRGRLPLRRQVGRLCCLSHGVNVRANGMGLAGWIKQSVFPAKTIMCPSLFTTS